MNSQNENAMMDQRRCNQMSERQAIIWKWGAIDPIALSKALKGVNPTHWIPRPGHEVPIFCATDDKKVNQGRMQRREIQIEE